MAGINKDSGLAPINNAQIYYEIAGEGTPLVLIHAGVADSRQWENEFAAFTGRHRVLRYDMRGYGKSEPVEGEFNHLQDLSALLEHLEINYPLIVLGCSMGGGLAMDYALTHPSRVKALIMVGAAPSGLTLDVPSPPIFEQAEQAYEAGDLDRLAEIETQIWFDGIGRTPDQVNPAMRELAYTMNRTALSHEAKGLGVRVPNTEIPAAQRLDELPMPVLVIAGEHDVPYTLAAADYMAEKLTSARKVIMPDAAHMPNLDHPEEFQRILGAFLDEIPV